MEITQNFTITYQLSDGSTAIETITAMGIGEATQTIREKLRTPPPDALVPPETLAIKQTDDCYTVMVRAHVVSATVVLV